MSELKWDQVQLPSFGGAVQNQIAAAKLLDDAIGKGITMNNNISENRRDNTMKGILGNLTKYTTGEEANEALRSGSLLEGVDLSQLKAEDLRALQKDIMGVHDLENKGIKNTQGYLDHDLTRANTGLVGANTANVINSTRLDNNRDARASEKHRSTLDTSNNQRAYENWFLQNTSNMNAREREEFARSDANRQAIGQFGIGFDTAKQANQYFDSSAQTVGNLALQGNVERARDDNYRDIEAKAFIDDIVNNSTTTGEIESKVTEAYDTFDNATKAAIERVSKEKGINLSSVQPIDDSGMRNLSPSQLQTMQEDALGTEVSPQTPEEIKAEALGSNAFDKSYEGLTKGFDAQYDSVVNTLAGVVDPSSDAPSMSKMRDSARRAVPSMTYADYSKNVTHGPFGSVNLNEEEMPFNEGEFKRIADLLGEDIYEMPLTADNVFKFQQALDGANKDPKSNAYKQKVEDNKRKRKEAEKAIGKNAANFFDEGVERAMKQEGLTDLNDISTFANNYSMAAAAEEMSIKKSLGNIPEDTPAQMKLQATNLADEAMQNPSRFKAQLANQNSTMIEQAKAANLGPFYFDNEVFKEVPNNATSVANAAVKASGTEEDVKKTADNIKKIMIDQKIDSKTAGSILMANGFVYNKDQVADIYDKHKDISGSSTTVNMKQDIAEIEGYEKQLDTLTNQLATMTHSRKGVKQEDIEKVKSSIRAVTLDMLRANQKFKRNYDKSVGN